MVTSSIGIHNVESVGVCMMKVYQMIIKEEIQMNWKQVFYSVFWGALTGGIVAIPADLAFNLWTPSVWTAIVLAIIKGGVAMLPEPQTVSVNGKKTKCCKNWVTTLKTYV